MADPSTNSRPRITSADPNFALPGGEIRIWGAHLMSAATGRPEVRFGEERGAVVFGSSDSIVARVPEDGTGPLTIATTAVSEPFDVTIAQTIAENLHPVANPAVDRDGNIFATFSGSRGQAVPVAIYKIDPEYNITPYVSEMMNATGLALDSEGFLYVSSRMDGTVYRVAPNGSISVYAQGMGVATGIAFDHERNLYVGDRSGTIFKIATDRQIYVYATLEPSVAAYHLAFSPNGNLYVSSPTTSSNDAVYEIDPHGDVTVFFRGLGRPQGLAFDFDGNMFVAASYGGRRGIVRITPDRNASLFVSGNDIVGLAFAPNRSTIIATNDAVHYLAWDVPGRVLVAD
ncbi:MAG TPA: IPT/TIG domain-containing protein [Clostridia bacterium]|nr:IPT/TIG domain-containing protein [Clostridia bacterium]